MYKITREQFLLRQPSFPETEPSDEYYWNLANTLLHKALATDIVSLYPETVIARAALGVTGYFQDVVADAGVWRSFINENVRLYGKKVPFFQIPEDYVDYELNFVDIRFLCWYLLSMNYEHRRVVSPLDPCFNSLAQLWVAELDAIYDSAPVPDGYKIARELEVDCAEDSQAVLQLGNWLFMHSYLLTPAYAITLSEILEEPGMKDPDKIGELQERLERSMAEDPTGPLALYLREWLYLIIENKTLPVAMVSPSPSEPHKYYQAFTKATGGKTIGYFRNYDSLNRFFIESLGWAEGEEHLPQMKNGHDFVLLVNHDKGMLLARNVAKCIADPENPLYDKAYASHHAIDLLTVRGLCPADLLHYICERGWLCDAAFPDGNIDTHDLVKDNYDFIARCFLQQYYRGD